MNNVEKAVEAALRLKPMMVASQACKDEIHAKIIVSKAIQALADDLEELGQDAHNAAETPRDMAQAGILSGNIVAAINLIVAVTSGSKAKP